MPERKHLEPSPLINVPPIGQEVCRIGYIVHAPPIQLAFQRDGVHEFYDVLSEEIRN